jgi:hypothetical protein
MSFNFAYKTNVKYTLHKVKHFFASKVLVLVFFRRIRNVVFHLACLYHFIKIKLGTNEINSFLPMNFVLLSGERKVNFPVKEDL